MSAMSVLGASATAALLGIAATWATRRFAVARGIVNHPNPLVPQHRKPVAYLGGVAIFIAAALTVALAAIAQQFGWITENSGAASLRLALPALLFVALGVVDDLHVLRASTKFAGQILIALLAAALGLIYPFTGQWFVDAAVSAFVILTLVNAFNLTDVCDGLVGGLSVVLFAATLLACDASQVVVIASILGACLGFLAFNRPPASIFLGDAGSHLLGFLAAAVLLRLPSSDVVATDVARVALLAGVPLFELALLIAVRTQKGIAWWRGSPDHFALRLQAAGLTRLQTDLIAWGAAAALAGAGLMLPSLPATQQAIVLALVVCAMMLAWRTLLQWEVTPGAKPITDATAAASGVRS